MDRAFALTTKWSKLALRLLAEEVGISQGSDPKTPQENAIKNYRAVWDTGATGSAVTERVAAELGLQPVDLVTVSTASGEMQSNAYLVNVILPMKVRIAMMKVTTADLGKQGVDVLLGMDIIVQGDFSVTNYKGKTTLSFRVPSLHEIDYVKDIDKMNSERAAWERVPPDRRRCLCGSGKKWKNCCAKSPQT